jgi:FkbM family methyltransferase
MHWKLSSSCMATNKNALAATSAFVTAIMILLLIGTVSAFYNAKKYQEGTGPTAISIIFLIAFLLSIYPTVFTITQTSTAFNNTQVRKQNNIRGSFVFVSCMDGYGEDGPRLTKGSPDDWKTTVLSTGCVAVNTLGVVKRSIGQVGFNAQFPFEDTSHGLWVTTEEYTKNPAFDVIKKVLNMHAKTELRHGVLLTELVEQYMSVQAIEPTDVVLELGGNIGRNSLMIANLLTDDRNLVTVECDPEFAGYLDENRSINKRNFAIVTAALSKRRLIQSGWDTKPLADGAPIPTGWKEVATLTWTQLQQLHPLRFNVLVADCEGALVTILKDEPDLLAGFNKLLIEQDGPVETRQPLREYFLKSGFVRTYSVPLNNGERIVEDFWETWVRRA